MSEERHYQPVYSTTQQGARPDGRGQVCEVPEEQVRSYYGRPVLKEPVWEWQIPWYFFTGGLAGASSGLALLARLTGNDALARRAHFGALAGATASPVLLVWDLGRPARFYEMLRVFKPTSPMSVGTWILSIFGSTTGVAVAHDLFGVFPKLGRVCETLSALLGLPLATYTAVLVADTSVPVWHEARRELPFVFAASSAGAFAAILTPVEDAGPARRLAVGGALLEFGAVELMKRKLGEFLAEPYEQGETRRYDKLAKAFSGLGAAVTAFAAPKSRTAAFVGGTLILAGAVCERWSVFKAGFQSSQDPKYTVMPQRKRLRDRTGHSE